MNLKKALDKCWGSKILLKIHFQKNYNGIELGTGTAIRWIDCKDVLRIVKLSTISTECFLLGSN